MKPIPPERPESRVPTGVPRRVPVRKGGRSTGVPRTAYADLWRQRIPEVEPIGGLFQRLVREFAPAVAPDAGARLEEIAAIWRRAVGEEIAAHTRPGRFRGGVLTIEVDSAPLAAELGSFARGHLHRALEREGLTGLCELKFRTGRGPSASPLGSRGQLP